MQKQVIPPSELVLNDDGSLYHIHLRPEHIAPTVILVGDQGRVKHISKYFDQVECKIQNREFITHTGIYKGKRISVISTGIGTDNIDIVINELDAAVNIDLENRTLREKRTELNLIRIGTSGAIHKDIDVGSYIVSDFGLGFDGLIFYYQHEPDEKEYVLNKQIIEQLGWHSKLSEPYIASGDKSLIGTLGKGMIHGITATATGFYGPQGRKLFLKPSMNDINSNLAAFQYNEHRITNFEMETSALYALGKLMGHKCCTCCGIIANRIQKRYSEDKQAVMDGLIKTVLERIPDS